MIHFDKLCKQANFIVIKYFNNHGYQFRNNACEEQDLRQEANILVWHILKSKNYQDKPFPELKKIINSAVGRRMEDLKNKAHRYAEKFTVINLEMQVNDDEYLDSLNPEDSRRKEIYPFINDLGKLGVCTPQECDLIHKRFVLNRTMEEIGAEYKVSKGRISQIFKEILEKVKNKLNNS
jgi:RNA polymerase sigma factor (sigma-70 family)